MVLIQSLQNKMALMKMHENKKYFNSMMIEAILLMNSLKIFRCTIDLKYYLMVLKNLFICWTFLDVFNSI